jgi:N-acylneuraminate cytidylyltransferase
VNVCIIPARGGSKGIPYKNIVSVGGKPLIWWTLNAANKSNLDKIYVSTDSGIIKNEVESFNFGKVEVIDRSEEVSTDTASTESVMVEFAENHEFDNIMLIQATSPLLKTEHINEALDKLKGEWDSVLSLVRQYSFQWGDGLDDDVVPQYDIQNRPRRQDHGGRLIENGAMYLTTSEAFRKSKCRVSGWTTFVEMPEYSIQEIDDMADIIIMDSLLKIYG